MAPCVLRFPAAWNSRVWSKTNLLSIAGWNEVVVPRRALIQLGTRNWQPMPALGRPLYRLVPKRNAMFRSRLVRMSPLGLAFTLGFTSMVGLMVVENLYDKYRRSSFTLREFLSSITAKSDENGHDYLQNGDFSTKYASLLTDTDVLNIKPSRTVAGAVNLPDIKITLFQYQTCPFCCKVRAFLDYYGLPYDIIEVNPVLRQQIKFSKLYRKVPILLISFKHDNFEQKSKQEILQINDSTLIVSALTSYLLSKKPQSRHHNESLTTLTRWYLNSQVYLNPEEEEEKQMATTYKARKVNDELVNRYFLMIGDVDPAKYEKMDPPLAEERRWRRWVDDHLVHVLSPNIYRTYDEALRSFNYFSEVGQWEKNFSNWERYTVINVGALAMYFISKRLKKKYDLKDDVRSSLYDSCNYWLKGVGLKKRFMGGDVPNLADLSVYGALSSIEGCDAFNDLLANTKISKWYNGVKEMVENHHGAKFIKPFL